jgi:hypothetical protein
LRSDGERYTIQFADITRIEVKGSEFQIITRSSDKKDRSLIKDPAPRKVQLGISDRKTIRELGETLTEIGRQNKFKVLA